MSSIRVAKPAKSSLSKRTCNLHLHFSCIFLTRYKPETKLLVKSSCYFHYRIKKRQLLSQQHCHIFFNKKAFLSFAPSSSFFPSPATVEYLNGVGLVVNYRSRHCPSWQKQSFLARLLRVGLFKTTIWFLPVGFWRQALLNGVWRYYLHKGNWWNWSQLRLIPSTSNGLSLMVLVYCSLSVTIGDR